MSIAQQRQPEAVRHIPQHLARRSSCLITCIGRTRGFDQDEVSFLLGHRLVPIPRGTTYESPVFNTIWGSRRATVSRPLLLTIWRLARSYALAPCPPPMARGRRFAKRPPALPAVPVPWEPTSDVDVPKAVPYWPRLPRPTNWRARCLLGSISLSNIKTLAQTLLSASSANGMEPLGVRPLPNWGSPSWRRYRFTSLLESMR